MATCLINISQCSKQIQTLAILLLLLSLWQFWELIVDLTDLQRMVEFAEGTPQEPSYKGLALFLKASYGFNATLDMGDVPYSEAGKAEEGITRPKYDKQAEVFSEVLNDLQEAANIFRKEQDFDGDIMYGGDVRNGKSSAMQCN